MSILAVGFGSKLNALAHDCDSQSPLLPALSFLSNKLTTGLMLKLASWRTDRLPLSRLNSTAY